MLIRFREQAVTLFKSHTHYLHSTTRDPTRFLQKYLVKSLGFSKEEAASTSAKVTSCQILMNPDSVISFLKQTGFDPAQIKTMVSKAPKLLFYDVDKTLKPKFKCLMDLGFSVSDLVNVITKDTTIVERSLDTRLKPTIDLLRRILGSDEAVVKAVKRSCWLLSFGGHHTMETNLMVLRNSGVPDMHIQKLVVRNPRCITQTTEWVKDILHRAVNDFQLPVDSPIFPYGFHALSAQNKTMLEKKIGVFKSFGWSDEEVLEMFRKSPYCVAHSEDRIRESLNFYVKELGYKPAYLASHPAILIYSLERRVVPRMQVLKILDEKKLKRRKFSLYSVLRLTELKFIELFVLPYKDQIPDLYESHKVLDRYAPQKQRCSFSISLQCHRNSSTSNLAPNTHLMEKYLVNSLGFSIEEAASTSSKVTSSRILKNPDSVLTFLKQNGFDPAQIKTMVSKAPKLLFYDVEKTLKPKFQCLMDLGFSQSDLVNVFVKDAKIFTRSLDTHIKPTIDLLITIMGSDEAVVKFVKGYPWVVSTTCRHTMETNLMVLRNSGVSDIHIQKLVVIDPRSMNRSTEWVKYVLHRAVNDFRLPVESPLFPYGFRALSQTKTMLEKKIGVFKSFGWSDEEVLEMIRKSPYCVTHSEDRIRKLLNFYVKELGYKPAYLASRPLLLQYSLEGRVVPRMQVLKILDEKKLVRRKYGLQSVVCIPELKFIELFVLPYKDQIPDLYESY